GGADPIETGDGDDIIIGGRFGDFIRARNGDNIVIGDSGQILAATVDSGTQAHFDGQPITLGRVTTLADTDGGDDIIRTLTGFDIILGGDGGDDIRASLINDPDADGVDLADLDAESTDTASDDANIILGDTGYIDWDDDEAIPGSDIGNVTNPDDIDEITSTISDRLKV
ncbi:MAG: hypothetical protein IIB11_03350, partial [Chloroflexi bacterium]|nr:hypothetical protein [Chloroflexota bacterium]